MRFRPVLLVTGLLPSLCYSFSDPNSLLKSLGFDFEDARERLLVERQGNRQTSRLSSGSNVIVVSITEELTVTRPTPSITITRTSTTGPVTVSPNPPDSLSSQVCPRDAVVIRTQETNPPYSQNRRRRLFLHQ